MRKRKLPRVGIEGFIALNVQLEGRFPICWSSQDIRALWRRCGSPKTFTALDILRIPKRRLCNNDAARAACLLLPIDLPDPSPNLIIGMTGCDVERVAWPSEIREALEKYEAGS